MSDALMLAQFCNITSDRAKRRRISSIGPAGSELGDNLHFEPERMVQWHRVGWIKESWQAFRSCQRLSQLCEHKIAPSPFARRSTVTIFWIPFFPVHTEA